MLWITFNLSFANASNLDTTKIFSSGKGLTLSQISPYLQNNSFENTVVKEKFAHNQEFPIFPQPFLAFLRTCHNKFSSISKLSSANYFSLEDSDSFHLGKG